MQKLHGLIEIEINRQTNKDTTKRSRSERPLRPAVAGSDVASLSTVVLDSDGGRITGGAKMYVRTPKAGWMWIVELRREEESVRPSECVDMYTSHAYKQQRLGAHRCQT